MPPGTQENTAVRKARRRRTGVNTRKTLGRGSQSGDHVPIDFGEWRLKFYCWQTKRVADCAESLAFEEAALDAVDDIDGEMIALDQHIMLKRREPLIKSPFFPAIALRRAFRDDLHKRNRVID